MLDQAVNVKPLVSKYAGKHTKATEGKVVAEVAPEALIPSVVETPTEDKSLDLFSSLVSDLLGDTKTDFDRMNELRKEAYALSAKTHAMDMVELEKKHRREASDWREMEPKDAQRQMYNNLTEQFKSEPEQLKIVRAALVDMENAYYQKDGDPVKKAKFAEMRLTFINKNPRMKENHAKNLERADVVAEKFLELALQHDNMKKEMKDKFEEANIIATLHGWPITEPKKK